MCGYPGSGVLDPDPGTLDQVFLEELAAFGGNQALFTYGLSQTLAGGQGSWYPGSIQTYPKASSDALVNTDLHT